MVEHMGGRDHLLARAPDVGRQPRLAGQVQAGEGLVQQHYAGRRHQQRQPADMLALAMAQAADGALRPVGRAALRQEFLPAADSLLARHALVLQVQAQFLFHGGGR